MTWNIYHSAHAQMAWSQRNGTAGRRRFGDRPTSLWRYGWIQQL